MRSGLLSPSQSVQSSVQGSSTLPHPREHVLKPGGTKESQLIRYMDDSIYRIQRRYLNRSDCQIGGRSDPDAPGYKNFADFKQDIEKLIDLVWVSGTPSVQIPYLLNLAMIVKEYLPGFPASPRSTFSLIGKLDLAFASLLQGRNVETGESLTGFDRGFGVSGTQKVRLKSIVDQTRVVVAEVLNEGEDEEMEEEEITDDDEIDEEDFNMETEDDMDVSQDHSTSNLPVDSDREIGIARIYKKVIEELGNSLGGAPIGIITDD